MISAGQITRLSASRGAQNGPPEEAFLGAPEERRMMSDVSNFTTSAGSPEQFTCTLEIHGCFQDVLHLTDLIPSPREVCFPRFAVA
jgi:hypothetical protein